MPNNVRANSKEHELERIDGIGPKIRAALVKGRVQTLTDLAGSSVDEIESILESGGLPEFTRTPERIEVMIKEAKDLVATQPKSAVQSDSTAATSQPTSVPEFTVFFNYGYIKDGQQRWRALVHPHDDGSKPEPSKWHLNPNDEGYTVRFEHQSGNNSQNSWQTVIYNGKTSEETDITGWTPDKWWPWITERASLTEEALQVIVQGEADIKSMPTSVGDKPVVAVESQAEKALSITRFEVHRPPDNRANILVADVVFEISEELFVEQPSSFQVEVLYLSLENNVSHVACYDSNELVPEQREYKSRVEFDMPELGEHMLHCVVLLPSGELGDYKKGHKITIIPKK